MGSMNDYKALVSQARMLWLDDNAQRLADAIENLMGSLEVESRAVEVAGRRIFELRAERDALRAENADLKEDEQEALAERNAALQQRDALARQHDDLWARTENAEALERLAAMKMEAAEAERDALRAQLDGMTERTYTEWKATWRPQWVERKGEPVEKRPRSNRSEQGRCAAQPHGSDAGRRLPRAAVLDAQRGASDVWPLGGGDRLMLNDEEIHGRWNKVDQRYADGCEPGDTHDEVSIYALINHRPIISDPGTLYVQDNTEALAQAWDEGFEAGEQAGLMPSMHGDAVNPYRDGSK